MKSLHVLIFVLLIANSASAGVTTDCLEFSNGQYATIEGGISLASEFTVETWLLRQEVIPGQLAMIFRHYGYFYFWMTDYEMTFVHHSIGGHVVVPGTPQVGTWTHIALTYDGTTVRVYANGNEIFHEDRTWSARSPDPVPVTIGGSAYDPTEHWTGMIDEVRVWDYGRSQAEIVEAMHIPVDPALTRFYWSFDEGGGQVIHDLSPFSYNDGYLGSWPTEDNQDPLWVTDEPVAVAPMSWSAAKSLY